GVKCSWSVADYRTPGSAAAAAQNGLDALGGIDILVNNAGRSQPGHLDSPETDWKDSYQLNFLSHLEAMRALLPGMRQARWGRVVNISGMAFRQPATINMGTTAKFALLATSKALSREVATTGVTVNAVTVGLIESHQINEIYFPDDEQRQQLAEREIPMGRLGHPPEVAAAVLFLVSQEAAYITGSTITVDGGMTHGV
ncbi:MAG: SDR family oxidoreductase, partial [Pseudonocardia sp.]|nr:SDR family oxidoreductase [Pseudonocardia sp.]